jgi:hypothetical protein
VFENGAPRKLFGPKMDEATGDWRKLLKEVLCDHTCYSTDIIRITKPGIMRWAGIVVLWGTGEVYKGFGCGNFKTGTT